MSQLTPKARKQHLLNAALLLAETLGYKSVTREDVAAIAECSPALVSEYFGTLAEFRRAIIGAAIATENLNILAQALAAGDPRVVRAPHELRHRAAMSLMGE